MAEDVEESPDRPSPAGDDRTDDVIERLERLDRLAKLRETGVLTEEEFQAEKARILGS